VASVDHYGNTWKTMNSIATLKFWERSQDISFALTKILSEPALETLIDPERIGFIGYSLGGMTGLYLAGAMPNELDQALASHKEVLSEFPPDTLSKVDFTPAKRSYCDSRIKAVLLLAPATWCFGKPQGFKDVHTPIGLVATLTDEVLPFHEHFHPLILHAIPARSKILKNGATHSAFLNRATKKGRAVLKEHLYRDPPGVDRLAIHEEVGTFAVDFFQQYLTPVQVLERVLSGK
jgi:predicted dienelactone hydrolase